MCNIGKPGYLHIMPGARTVATANSSNSTHNPFVCFFYSVVLGTDCVLDSSCACEHQRHCNLGEASVVASHIKLMDAEPASCMGTMEFLLPSQG